MRSCVNLDTALRKDASMPPVKPPLVLFVCKSRGVYCQGTFGLWNSAAFVASSLRTADIDARVTDAVDANCLDRIIVAYRPQAIILEAIWVTPDKLRELTLLHPSVRFVVRVHSKATFLATEGTAMLWLTEFARIPGVVIAGNNEEFVEDLTRVGIPCVFLPNIYTPPYQFKPRPRYDGFLNIGCFGAPRPMKNQLAQAMAAIIFGNQNQERIAFHINTSFSDPGTEGVVKNLRGLFGSTTQHRLVEHGWQEHRGFCQLVATMDLGMQVSLSESFNIVSADFVWQGVPIVASQEIKFVNRFCRSGNDTTQMLRALRNAYYGRYLSLNKLDKLQLATLNHNSLQAWLAALRSARGT
jgi:hypothetical protein